MMDSHGWRPWFQAINGWSISSRIIEKLLSLDDLEITDKRGKTLLWACSEKGAVTERVATDIKLVGQYGQSYQGTLPLEIGEHVMYNCENKARGIYTQAHLCQ